MNAAKQCICSGCLKFKTTAKGEGRCKKVYIEIFGAVLESVVFPLLVSWSLKVHPKFGFLNNFELL